jgi:hypothetical protein
LGDDEPRRFLGSRRDGATEEFWRSAEGRREEAPERARELIDDPGERRIEASPEEVEEVLRWARGLDGWSEARPGIFVHREEPDQEEDY